MANEPAPGLANLKVLHDAIIGVLRPALHDIALVEIYPDLQDQRSIPLPAVLIELAEIEPGSDPGTGQLGLVGRFQARAITDPVAPHAQLAVRELAARVALLAYQQSWGLPLSAARIHSIAECGMKPELDGYYVWMVEWTQQFLLGTQTWDYPRTTRELYIGIEPNVGLEYIQDYVDFGPVIDN